MKELTALLALLIASAALLWITDLCMGIAGWTTLQRWYRGLLKALGRSIKKHGTRFIAWLWRKGKQFAAWSWRNYKQFILGTATGILVTLYFTGRLT